MSADRAAVRQTVLGPLTHLAVAGSTNQLALEAAQAGATSGVWLADEQTAGRGRGGHAWHSAAGDGLYVSVLTSLPLPLDLAPCIPLATGLAAQSAVFSVTGFRLDIRWPNDLMAGEKKCGGILVESNAPAAGALEPRLRYAVVGVGINLNHQAFPPELAAMATSLRIETRQSVDRDTVLNAFLPALDQELTGLTSTPVAQLFRRFSQASTWVRGKRVQVGEEGGYTGVTCGLDSRGFLLVQTDDGTIRTVLSGGVRPAPSS